jgi:hypothetical protein
MKPVSHPSNTRTLQAPAGWDHAGVPVEPLGITDQVALGLPFVWSFWEPDAAERASIASGSKVVLSLLGRSMPPALLMVEEVRPGSAAPAVSSEALLTEEDWRDIESLRPIVSGGPDCRVAIGAPVLWRLIQSAEMQRTALAYEMPPALNAAAHDVIAERRRQVDVEGWTAEHDDSHVSDEIAAMAVVVDAKDENAAAFYRHYEFIPLQAQPRRLYVPMRVVAQLLG